jgi:molybdopterin molybdotransferase
MAGSGAKVNRQALSFADETIFAWRVCLPWGDSRMLSFREALDLLLKNTPLLASEQCRLEDAAGRVLRGEVVADRPFPPFDRVMMDGFALRSTDWQAGQRFFRVTKSAPAGQARVTLGNDPGVCVEVMTGAPCPLGADIIVPVEELLSSQARVVRFAEAHQPVPGRFIHRVGSDAAAGETLLRPGCRIGSREIGVAASCGAAWLEVSKLPDIAVIATGDELVAVDQKPAAHQIRQSNGHSIAAALQRAGHAPAHVGVLGDDITLAQPQLEKLLENHDWLILTGAVSRGSRDFVPLLLGDLGCHLVFHGVAQRPGKPAGCWTGPNGQLIMALPGNPVSALTGLHTFVFPALALASGLPLPAARRVVMADATTLPEFTRHLPVVLREDGKAEAADVGNSGDFIGLLKSEGFITLPPRGMEAAAFPFTPWL